MIRLADMCKALGTATLVALLGAGTTAAPTVSIDGAFVKPTTLDAAAIFALPHISLTVTEEHTNAQATYSAVPIATVLNAAGAPTGAAVKGAPARSYVVVHAADGYVAIYSLAELDTTQTSCAPLLADRRNGVPLTSDIGPFRLIAPCDRTHARWVHEVTGFTLVTVPKDRS